MRVPRWVWAGHVVAIACLLLPAPVGAVPLDWINAAGGFAGGMANWNPAQLPAAADDLRFNIPGAYSVTFGANVPTNAGLYVWDGSPTFLFPTPHTTTGSFNVSGTTAPVLTLASGTSTFNGLASIGNAGETGTLVIQSKGTQATWNGSMTVAGPLGGAVGTIQVSEGGRATFNGTLDFGHFLSSTGALSIHGANPVGPFVRSTVTHAPALGGIRVGQAGVGLAEVTAGGLLDELGSLHVAETDAGTGTVVVGGLSIVDSARITVGTDLWVGRNGNVDPAGTGVARVEAYGVLDVGGIAYLSDANGGQGSLEVLDHGRFVSRGLVVQSPATDLLLRGGLTQVIGGPLDLTGDALVVSSTTGSPALELLSGATATIAPTTAPAVKIGADGAGTLRVKGGSDLTVQNHDLLIAALAGSNGTLEVAGSGSTLTVSQHLIVGKEGTGTATFSNGSQTSVADLRVATQSGSHGAVTLLGGGTDVHASGILDVGGLTGGSSFNNDGALTIGSGARLWLDGVLGNVYPASTASINAGGELHITGVLYDFGLLTLNGGAIVGGGIALRDGGDLSGTGDVGSAMAIVGTDTSGTVTATGPLLLGRSDIGAGYSMQGTLDVGAHEVTLRDRDSALAGTVRMAGGTLHAPAGGVVLTPGHALTGNGTITGAITLRGSVYPSGALGLAFGGPVHDPGAITSGSLFRFLSGSTFDGSGTLDAAVEVDAGAVIAPTQTLSLGKGTRPAVLNLHGVLRTGPFGTYLVPTDTARVWGEIDLQQGGFIGDLQNSGLAGLRPLRLFPGALLHGNGTIALPVASSGTIAPGNSLGKITLTSLTTQGLRLDPTSELVIELGRLDAGEHDTLAVTGAVALGGTLDLELLPGFLAHAGDSVRILTSAGVTGSFSAMTVNHASTSGLFQVAVHGGDVWLVALGNVLAGPMPPAGSSLRFACLGSPGPRPVLALDLPEAARVCVEAFDTGGRRVATIADGEFAAGPHRLPANATALPSDGVYFVRARVLSAAGPVTRTLRMVRLR